MASSELQTPDTKGEPDVEVPADDEWFLDSATPRVTIPATNEWADSPDVVGEVRDKPDDLEEESDAASDWNVDVKPLQPPDEASQGVLPKIEAECQRRVELRTDEGNDAISAWVSLDPPTEHQLESRSNILGNWNNQPVKAGVGSKDMTQEKAKDDPHLIEYRVYRIGRYDVHYRVREVIIEDEVDWNHANTTDFNGQATVTVPETGPIAGALHMVAQYAPIQGTEREGWFTSDDNTISAGDALTVEVEGDIEPGADVNVTVTDEEGEPVANAGLFVKGPAEGMDGEVFVEKTS